MSSKKAVTRSLEKIEKEIDKTSNFIHINSNAKPMPLINIAIDKLYVLKEMEFNIKQLM